MFELTDYPSLLSAQSFGFFATAASSEYANCGFQLLNEDEQKKALALIKQIADPKVLDLNQIFTVVLQGGMIPSKILPPTIYWQNQQLQLKLGNNFVPLNFNEEKQCWMSPAKTPLTLTTVESATDKITYPVFQFGSKLTKISINWKPPKDLTPVKNKLIELLIPPSPDLEKYVKSFGSLTLPLYSLVLGAESSEIPYAYRVIDIDQDYDDRYGVGYVLVIHPDDVPKQDLFVKDKQTGYRTNRFRASNMSSKYLANKYDEVKLHMQNGVFYWLVISTPLATNGGNIVTNHAFFASLANLPFEQKIAIPSKTPPQIVEGQSTVVQQLKAAAAANKAI